MKATNLKKNHKKQVHFFLRKVKKEDFLWGHYKIQIQTAITELKALKSHPTCHHILENLKYQDFQDKLWF